MSAACGASVGRRGGEKGEVGDGEEKEGEIDHRKTGRETEERLVQANPEIPADVRLAMEEVAAELARNSAELTRLQRQAQRERARLRKQREHALLTATIAFCHEPNAGPTIAAAVKRKYARAVDEDADALTREIESRFLQTSVETLAQWLDWSDMSGTIQSEAQRFLEDARLLNWIGEQNSAQGIAPPPQFVWEKRCALIIDKTTLHREGAASWRPARSAAAKKWLQRFRKRWNLCLGRLPAKDVLPTATMQAKVRSGF